MATPVPTWSRPHHHLEQKGSFLLQDSLLSKECCILKMKIQGYLCTHWKGNKSLSIWPRMTGCSYRHSYPIFQQVRKELQGNAWQDHPMVGKQKQGASPNHCRWQWFSWRRGETVTLGIGGLFEIRRGGLFEAWRGNSVGKQTTLLKGGRTSEPQITSSICSRGKLCAGWKTFLVS